MRAAYNRIFVLEIMVDFECTLEVKFIGFADGLYMEVVRERRKQGWLQGF